MDIDKLKNKIKEFKKTEKKAITLIDGHLEIARQALADARKVSEKYGVPFGVGLESGYVHVPDTFSAMQTAVNDIISAEAEDVPNDLRALFDEYSDLFYDFGDGYWEASAYC